MEDDVFFESKVPDYLFCYICHEVFDRPSRIMCGHTFCLDCISGWLKKQSNCPQCRQKNNTSKVFADLVAQYIVNDLIVKCKNNPCCWEGRFEEAKNHLKTCEKIVKKIEEPKATNKKSFEAVDIQEKINNALNSGKSAGFIQGLINILEKKLEKRKVDDITSIKKIKKW